MTPADIDVSAFSVNRKNLYPLNNYEFLTFAKSVHTRLGHFGSPKDSAMVGPVRSVCTNVVWFDLG